MAKFFKPETDPKLFKCGCGRAECDAPQPSADLLVKLDMLRMIYGNPIKVRSGPRCAFWNAHEGGKLDSDHLTGEGADLECVTSRERYKMIASIFATGFHRYGIGRDFVHVGIAMNKPQEVAWTYY